MKKKRHYIVTRNYVAVDAWNRKGGSHGGSKKAKVRRERKSIRQTLRNLLD